MYGLLPTPMMHYIPPPPGSIPRPMVPGSFPLEAPFVYVPPPAQFQPPLFPPGPFQPPTLHMRPPQFQPPTQIAPPEQEIVQQEPELELEPEPEPTVLVPTALRIRRDTAPKLSASKPTIASAV